MIHSAEVYLWGSRIGYVHLEPGDAFASFEYDKDFRSSGIQLAPIHMPLSDRVYRFTDLPIGSFHGLPGLLADSVPDRFGNAIIDNWLASQGREPESFNIVERLCYTGSRGMGALEYVPAKHGKTVDSAVDINGLVQLSSDILSNRRKMHFNNETTDTSQLLQLGTSAGGARAKAIIAIDEETKDIRSGQISNNDKYSYWLMKFDNVSANGDHDLQDAPEYTLIEYAYYLMACAAGINMNECRIYQKNGMHHFMTKRFDRSPANGDKIHMQTLGAIAHADYNAPGSYSYEEAAMCCFRLGLMMNDIEQLFRRMVFNIMAVNQDDHVKNISFLMNRRGIWSLAPAYDVTFAWNPSNYWLSSHQMSVNGKRSEIGYDDIAAAGRAMDISASRIDSICNEVRSAVNKWPEYARAVNIREDTIQTIDNVMQQNCID